MSNFPVSGERRETLEHLTDGLHLHVLPIGSDKYVNICGTNYRRYVRLDEKRVQTYIVGSRREEILDIPLVK